MNRLWLIVWREYLYNLMRKSFLFTAFVLPLFMMAGMYGVIALAGESARADKLDEYQAVGYVDKVGFLGNVSNPDYERFIPYESEDSARAAFDSNSLDAYIIVPEDYLETGKIHYFSEKGIPLALSREIDNFLLHRVTTLAPENVPVERLRDPVNGKVYTFGATESVNEDALVGRFVLPIVFAVIFIFTILTTSQFLMSGVVEEKENRIMEILITSVRPRELLIGKVLGLGALALTQVVVWLTASITIAALTGRLDFLEDMQFKPLELVLMLTYFVLSFLLFAGIMVGIGASVSAEQESRQASTIFVLAAISPSWFVSAFINSPTGAVATFFSLFPLTAPITNLFLIGMGEARTWQIILSLAIMVVSIVLVMWVSVRLFHTGMLMYGQRLGWKQIRRALVGS